MFEAGVGTGKSYAGSVWSAMMVFTHPGVRGIIVARDVPQLRKGTLVEFKKVLCESMQLVEDVDFVHNLSNNSFKFSNGSQVDCVGATNYDSAFRAASYGWAWADEVDYYKPEAWQALLGRIRTEPELIRATSSPKGFNFVYDHFINPETKSNKAEVIKATTFDNPFVSDTYRESLKEAYSPRLYRQEVLGERLNLQAGMVYSEFDRSKHVGKCPEYGFREPIHIYTDYNVGHYTALAVKYDKGTLYIVDEVHLRDANTHKMAAEIQKRWPDNPIIISGDSTGNNQRNVSSTMTNYEIFRSFGFTTKPEHNPPVIQRIITVESGLYHCKIVIASKCVTLIRDLELVSWKEKSNGNEIDKTSDLSLTHMSDAFGYAVYGYLPLRPAQQKSTTRYL